MRFARTMSVVVASCLFAGPLCADHVSSRRAAAPASSAAVQDRLVSLGVAPADAAAQVAALTPAELSFFAADPARVQVVGAAQDMFAGQSDNLWYETIAGGGFFMFGVGLIMLMLTHRE